jgi:predicted TIM-barrel fold metal-dependent hydrolase
VLNGSVVIDATTHTYNLADDNLRPGRYATVFREVLWGMHARCTPPHARIDRASFCSDWSPEILARTLFTESYVDLAVHHRLRLDSLFADGLVREEKSAELVRRWPHRFLTYAGVNPLDGAATCRRELREQVERLPGTVGVKLYPDAGTPDRSWRMDDPGIQPIFELAIDLGLKVIAVHKVVPNGLTPLDPYRIDDLERAAIAYPQLNFEIVHAGMLPFVDEVTLALARLRNVYANLEITSAFLERGFGFARDALAQFIAFAGADRILFASGGLHFHPQPVIESIAAMTFPDELRDRYRIGPFTDAQKAGILGGNYARMVGLDLDAVRRDIAGDEFGTPRPDRVRPPWTAWRAAAADRGLVPA